ncbi:MAG: CAP domain-containing protein [Lachnospiraceae bacterium]|nr:CAP domain-containing protein [Lachnospiraceae bacterium]MCM1233692.1 CAP domain-containing protein [Ruminococcus flavefaciens]
MAETEYPEKADELARLVNVEREKIGLKPLFCVPYLNQVAMLRASEASTYWSHTRPNGEYFVTAVDTNIIDYASIAENLAATSETASGALEQWRNSAKHWAAIVNEGYTHMGMGVVYNPSGVNNAGWYWCQIFSNDLRGDDYVYTGQYLPEKYSGAKITICITDDSTGENIAGVPILLFNLQGVGENISAAQNGRIITFEPYAYFNENDGIIFTSGDYPTEISGLEYSSSPYQIRLQDGASYYSTLANRPTFTVSSDNIVEPKIIEVPCKPTQLSVKIQPSGTAKLEISGKYTKYDLSCISVENADISEISEDKNSVAITSEQSEILIEKLPAGTYDLKISEGPAGYKLVTTSFSLSTTRQMNINLQPVTLFLYVYGINENGQQALMSSAEYKLTFLDDGTLENCTCAGKDISIYGNIMTIAFGTTSAAVIRFLPAGNYRLTEISPPEGHNRVQDITFSIGTDGNVNNLTNAVLLSNTAIKIVHEKCGAFENAEKLGKIVIPESVKKIGTKSFAGTSLKSAKIAPDCEYSETSFPDGCKIELY